MIGNGQASYAEAVNLLTFLIATEPLPIALRRRPSLMLDLWGERRDMQTADGMRQPAFVGQVVFRSPEPVLLGRFVFPVTAYAM
jgi:hypothetical protein